MGFKVLQVSNITPQATKEQIHTLFSYLGRIRQFKLYPSESNITPTATQKFAYIEFEDEKCVELGQHLTNTVLIDRAIVCVPSMDETIPSEESCLAAGGPTMPGQRSLPAHITNKIHDVGDGTQVVLTIDPTLEQLGLPAYPPLPANTDPSKIEEIRRTIYVGNIPKGTDGQTIVDFFNNNIGEVMYMRMADGPPGLPSAYCYIEFTNQSSVPVALQNSAMIALGGNMLRMQHSRVAIIKPQQKTDAQALEEIEIAIKAGGRGDDRVRSRSRSPRRRRSISPRRSRSPRRSPIRRRDRSRDRDRRRSKSRDRKRSRSRERKRSRSRDRDRDSKRDRSRDRRDRERKRSRSRDRDSKRERDRKRSRSRDRSDKKRDRSRDRRDKDKDRKKDKERESKKIEKEEEKLRERLLEKVAARSESSDVQMKEEENDIKNEDMEVDDRTNLLRKNDDDSE